jgi:hypothetical protein
MLRKTVSAVALILGVALCAGCGSGSSTNGSSPLDQLLSATPAPIVPVRHTPKPHYCFHSQAQQQYILAVHAVHPRLKDFGLCYDLKKAVKFCGHQPHGDNQGLLDTIIGNLEGFDFRFAAQHLCPKLLPIVKQAAFGVPEDEDATVGHHFNEQGYHSVITPGTYKTTQRGVYDCYWERETRGGDTIANNFIHFAPGHVTVTVYSSDGGFSSQGCGNWVKVG